jgi:hypothetical protein
MTRCIVLEGTPRQHLRQESAAVDEFLELLIVRQRLSGNILWPHFNALLLLASSSSRDTALATSVTPKTTSDMFDPGSVPQ